MGTLVTVGTDGFRDFVELPDGRTFNLGSVSVLKFVTTLVASGAIARKVLDTFLKKNKASLAVDLPAMEDLLRPKRSRWAVHENRLIPPVLRPSPFRGANTMNTQAEAFLKQVSAVEAHLAAMAQTPNTAHVAQLKTLVAQVVNSERASFQSTLASIEGLLSTFQPGTVNPGKVNALRKLARELLGGSDSKQSEEKESRFEEGKPADPTENMSPEDAKEWKKQNDLNKDKFKSAAEDKKESEEETEEKKEAAFKLATVNEAIAMSLMTKVEGALQVVTASDRTNTEVAKMDLHLISEKLASLLQEKELTAPDLQPGLMDLAGKVARIRGHFDKKTG